MEEKNNLPKFGAGMGLNKCATLMTGFMVVIILFKKAFTRSKLARILVGGGAALVASCLIIIIVDRMV